MALTREHRTIETARREYVPGGADDRLRIDVGHDRQPVIAKPAHPNEYGTSLVLDPDFAPDNLRNALLETAGVATGRAAVELLVYLHDSDDDSGRLRFEAELSDGRWIARQTFASIAGITPISATDCQAIDFDAMPELASRRIVLRSRR